MLYATFPFIALIMPTQYTLCPSPIYSKTTFFKYTRSRQQVVYSFSNFSESFQRRHRTNTNIRHRKTASPGSNSCNVDLGVFTVGLWVQASPKGACRQTSSTSGWRTQNQHLLHHATDQLESIRQAPNMNSLARSGYERHEDRSIIRQRWDDSVLHAVIYFSNRGCEGETGQTRYHQW